MIIDAQKSFLSPVHGSKNCASAKRGTRRGWRSECGEDLPKRRQSLAAVLLQCPPMHAERTDGCPLNDVSCLGHKAQIRRWEVAQVREDAAKISVLDAHPRRERRTVLI